MRPFSAQHSPSVLIAGLAMWKSEIAGLPIVVVLSASGAESLRVRAFLGLIGFQGRKGLYTIGTRVMAIGVDDN